MTYYDDAMRFLKRHWFFLAFVVVLVLCSVQVIRQFLANQWNHIDLREDFIVLHDQGQTKGAERLYQLLIQQLPGLPDRALVDDDQRLTFLLSQTKLPDSDLICKYRVGVDNELQSRTSERINRALKRAGNP